MSDAIAQMVAWGLLGLIAFYVARCFVIAYRNVRSAQKSSDEDCGC